MVNAIYNVFFMSIHQVFDVCTVLFSDVAGFAQICTAISPMQVVTMLNLMYTSFDNIIEKHNCYKVLNVYIDITFLGY